MNNPFEKKAVLVTGGGTGIGRTISKRFSDKGADVIIIGRSKFCNRH